MLGNRRGVVPIIVVGYMVGAIVAGVCAMWIWGPHATKHDVAHTKQVRYVPAGERDVKMPDGTVEHQINYVKEELETDQSIIETPKASLWSKILGLGTFALIALGVLITATGSWPIVLPMILSKLKAARADVKAWIGKHNDLHACSVDIVQAIDDGWDAFDAQVAVYTELMNKEPDLNKKNNLLTIVSALQTAKKAMKDKMYAEMDNASWAKLAELQAHAAPTSAPAA